jgi:hypothetical protein
MKNRKKSQARNPALDLFDEVPVTWPEVWHWLETVPHIPRESWRAAYYLKCWNVPDKIRAAKLNGTYENIIHHQA